MIELPNDLQGYGIETGDPDYDRLAEHGKLDRFRIWQQRNLKENPQVPDAQERIAARQKVRDQVSDIMITSYFSHVGTRPVIWN